MYSRHVNMSEVISMGHKSYNAFYIICAAYFHVCLFAFIIVLSMLVCVVAM